MTQPDQYFPDTAINASPGFAAYAAATQEDWEGQIRSGWLRTVHPLETMFQETLIPLVQHVPLIGPMIARAILGLDAIIDDLAPWFTDLRDLLGNPLNMGLGIDNVILGALDDIPLLQPLISPLVEAITGSPGTLSELADWMVNLLSVSAQMVINALVEYITDIPGAHTLEELVDALQEVPLIKPLVEAITGISNGTLGDLTTYFTNLVAASAQSLIDALYNFITGGAGSGYSLDDLITVLPGVGLISDIVEAITGVTGDLTDLADWFTNLVAASAQALLDALYNFFAATVGSGRTVNDLTSLLDAISTLMDSVVGTADTTLAGLVGHIGGLLGPDSPLNPLRLNSPIPAWLLPVVPVASIINNATNLLANPGFSGAVSMEGGEDWTWANTVYITGSTDNEPGSARVTADSMPKGLRSNSIAVGEGQTLECEVKILTSALSATGSPITLSVYVNNAAIQIASSGEPTGNGSEWTGAPGGAKSGTLSGTYDVPAGVDTVQLRLGVDSQATSGTIWFDQAVLRRSTLMPQTFIEGVLGDLTDDLAALLPIDDYQELLDVFKGGVGGALSDVTARLQKLATGTGLIDAAGLTNLENIGQIAQTKIANLVDDLADLLPAATWQDLLDAFANVSDGSGVLQDVIDRITHLSLTGWFDSSKLENLANFPSGLTISKITNLANTVQRLNSTSGLYDAAAGWVNQATSILKHLDTNGYFHAGYLNNVTSNAYFQNLGASGLFDASALTNIANIPAIAINKVTSLSGYLANLNSSGYLSGIGAVSGLSNYLAYLNGTYGTFDASALTNLANIPAIGIGSITSLTNYLQHLNTSGNITTNAAIPTLTSAHIPSLPYNWGNTIHGGLLTGDNTVPQRTLILGGNVSSSGSVNNPGTNWYSLVSTTVTVGPSGIVLVSASGEINIAAVGGGRISWGGGGYSPDDTRSSKAQIAGFTTIQTGQSRTDIVTGLSTGSTVFTLYVRETNAGTCNFANCQISVLPL